MSHNIMSAYKISTIDCVWDKCKNLQRINTIEIFFKITTDDDFAIEYNFHSIDFNLWKQILIIHRDQNDDSLLYNSFNEIINIEFIKNDSIYYTFILKSKNFNLYRNINLFLYLENDSWNNMEEMLRNNTWGNRGLI